MVVKEKNAIKEIRKIALKLIFHYQNIIIFAYTYFDLATLLINAHSKLTSLNLLGTLHRLGYIGKQTVRNYTDRPLIMPN